MKAQGWRQISMLLPDDVLVDKMLAYRRVLMTYNRFRRLKPLSGNQ